MTVPSSELAATGPTGASPRRRWIRVLALGVPVLLVSTLALAAIGKPPPLPDTNRHAESRITSLARYGDDAADPIWVYITSLRNIQIRPDGSGQIAEQFLERTFPTPGEEAQWLASEQEGYDGVNESFAAGDLFYYSSDEVRAGVGDLTLRFAPPGDALRRVASLLAETAPSDAVLESALATAMSLNGVEVRSLADSVVITGVGADGALEVTLVFELSPVRLVDETWMTRSGLPGVERQPPFEIFRRTILLNETVAAF